MPYNYNITGTVGETLTISFNNIFSDYYSSWVAGIIGLTQSYQNLPSWAIINDSENVNNLAYPFNIMSGNSSFTPYLINGTDYLKEIQITPQSQGVYTFYFRVFAKVNVANVFPLSQGTGKLILTVNAAIPPQPNNPQGIQYNTYDRYIRVEKNVLTSKSFGTDGLYPNGEEIIISSTLPAWITNNTINSRTQTWDITAPSINTYYYYGNVYLRNEFKGSATITLQVVESLFDEIDNCCSDENINIVWLNRQGGRGNFIFTQRRDYKVNIGDKKTYITKDIKRYSEINKVYNATTVYATGLSLNQIDFLDTLRYSIQAWVFVNEVFIPIILDVESFDKYNTKENMYDISLSFNYAEQLNIQRQ